MKVGAKTITCKLTTPELQKRRGTVDGETATLELTGPEGTKMFLEQEVGF